MLIDCERCHIQTEDYIDMIHSILCVECVRDLLLMHLTANQKMVRLQLNKKLEEIDDFSFVWPN